jgi:hypothetical protein
MVNVLNIGAGEALLHSQVLTGVLGTPTRVNNVDIYQTPTHVPQSTRPTPGRRLTDVGLQLARAPGLVPPWPTAVTRPRPPRDPRITYGNATELLPAASATIDILVAVSPYGFPVINRETLRVLKADGYILVLGNGRNPYVSTPFKLFSPEVLVRREEEVREAVSWAQPASGEAVRVDPRRERVQKLVYHLLTTCNSRTTDGSNPTLLNTVRVFRKAGADEAGA